MRARFFLPHFKMWIIFCVPPESVASIVIFSLSVSSAKRCVLPVVGRRLISFTGRLPDCVDVCWLFEVLAKSLNRYKMQISDVSHCLKKMDIGSKSELGRIAPAMETTLSFCCFFGIRDQNKIVLLSCITVTFHPNRKRAYQQVGGRRLQTGFLKL